MSRICAYADPGQRAPPAACASHDSGTDRCDYSQRLLDSTQTPGAGLAIVRHDSVLFTGGIGRARVVPTMQASEKTLFRIGSISKQFVALVALELQREGKLSLQDPLASRLPGFWFRNA